MKSPILLYEDKPKIDNWFKVFLVGIPALELVLGLALINVDIHATWVLIGTTVFLVLLFWVITLRSYQIYADRLVIKLGAPFAVNIPLSSIDAAKKASEYYAFGYWGIRFATSTSNVLEIKRNRGMSYIISPSNADMFIEQFDQARRSYSEGH